MNGFLTHTRTHTRTRTHTYIWINVPSYDSFILLQQYVSEESYSSDRIISYLIWLDKIIIIILLLWYYLHAITIHWIMIVIVIICNESVYISSRLVLSCLDLVWVDYYYYCYYRHDVVWARLTLPSHIISYHILCFFILSLLLICSPFHSILFYSFLLQFKSIWFDLIWFDLILLYSILLNLIDYIVQYSIS